MCGTMAKRRSTKLMSSLTRRREALRSTVATYPRYVAGVVGWNPIGILNKLWSHIVIQKTSVLWITRYTLSEDDITLTN